MKKEFLLWVGVGSGVAISLWAASAFRESQEIYFHKKKEEQLSLQRNLKVLEDDLAFIRNHQKELDDLVEKGWFIPKNRLIAGKFLETLQGNLNHIQYTFEPENTKSLGEDYTFKVTKVVLDVGALLDTDIYAFVGALLETFSGILNPLEFTLARGEEVNETNLAVLTHEKRPNFVVGKLVFEWVAMGDDDHEK